MRASNLSDKINTFLSVIEDKSTSKDVYSKLQNKGFKYTEREVSGFLAYVLYPKYVGRVKSLQNRSSTAYFYLYSKKAKT